MSEVLPTVNAVLNGLSGILVALGVIMIKRGRRDVHKRLMLAAVGCSTLFLVSYITRVALTGTHRFPDVGVWKTVYLVVLTSHTLLAVVVAPLVVRAVYLALKARFAEHRRLVRFLYPAWLYVSVTGVVVYVMLYHLAPRWL